MDMCYKAINSSEEETCNVGTYFAVVVQVLQPFDGYISDVASAKQDLTCETNTTQSVLVFGYR